MLNIIVWAWIFAYPVQANQICQFVGPNIYFIHVSVE